MTVTIYNPTTGRYVTTLTTSAGSQKQASTAALKSKAGGQAAPLTPSVNAVKVSLSSTAKSVLAGTTRYKLSELVTRLDDPKFSPNDLAGVTLYLDSDLKEITDLPSATYNKLLNLLTAQGGRKLMDVRAANDVPVKLDGATYAKIQSNPAARALLDVTSNLSLDLATGSDGRVASDMNAATLTRFKELIESNKATKVTIDGQTSPVTLTPDVVQSLGAKTLARYPGKITVDANADSMLTADNWENLRVLNNYRDIAINLGLGVPSSKVPIASLSQAMSKLSYQQFIGGFNLVNAVTVKPAPIALEPSTYDSTTKTQKVLFSGLFMNGDSVQMSVTAPNGVQTALSVGPLVMPKGASAEQQGAALLASLQTALTNAAKTNTSLSQISVTRTGNELSFTYSGSVPVQTPLVSFAGSNRATEGAPTFGVELTNVPPSAVESLTNYSQVYGLNVKGSADQLINNSDKLNKLISNGFVKTVQLIDAKSGEPIVAPGGQFSLTAAQAARSIPLLEKVGAGIISISDNKSAPSSYASFTNAAANNLVGGLRIVGTATEIQNSLQGLSALARMGKIATLVMTGNNGRQTTIDNFDSSKLSALVVSLRQGG
ncbi:MAG: hypothetical protein RIQ68_2403 [Pseudomonadota bacterium]